MDYEHYEEDKSMSQALTYTAEEICEKLNLDINDIWNIYPYGSRVYGTADIDSDYDYIIVYKRSLLPSGAFKDNAISSKDRMIQGTCYSRGGFVDAINNYQMPVLEAIFLPDDMVVKKTFDFKIYTLREKDLVRKVISLASASWHNAVLSYKDDNQEYVAKNIYHALRILDFGKQIKDNGKIVEYGSMNQVRKSIYDVWDTVKPKEWHDTFIKMSNDLKSVSTVPPSEDEVILKKIEVDDHQM